MNKIFIDEEVITSMTKTIMNLKLQIKQLEQLNSRQRRPGVGFPVPVSLN